VHTGQLIAGGQPASKTLSGDDELAALDKSLHQLQDALKNMRQRERTILDNAAEIICTMDEDLRFSDINNAVQKIWGFRPAELLGKKATDMMEKQDQKAAIKALRDASQSAPEGGQVHFEARVTRADGTISDTRWSASYSANTRTICCLVKDSTEHQDIGRLNQAFVTMVRDDLQTPLTAIQMAHSMIEQDLRERPTGNQITQKNLVIGRDNINRLMLLVNNLLDADKGQSEQIDLVLQQQLLLPVVQAAADSLSAIAQNTKVTVGIYVDPKLMAYFDREKLIKVLVSLISNAYKFSPQSAQVRVVAVATEGKERGFVRLAVIDQGPGVPPAMQGKIFEGFRQSEATEGRSQTVGLSICKAIIEQHRGQMGVKSQDGNGSTFWFTVPSQPARKDW
jgi:PAS domain S-box-containing protein